MKIASVLALATCGGKWALSYVKSEKKPINVSLYVSSVKNGEKNAIVGS